jgi:glycosyltransferase involved in cell wall biosynthesis
MMLSILIPTHNRPLAINQCLAHLATQEHDVQIEIIVGLDGPSQTTPDPIIDARLATQTKCVRFSKSGYIPIRKNLLERSQGDFVLWLNDDSYAQPGLIEAHMNHHRNQSQTGSLSNHPTVVAGSSAWKQVPAPDLFDQVVQDTDLIFFKPQADQSEQATLVNYRNCFGLNMSFPRQLAIDAGSLPELTDTYGYDDIELAFRLANAGAQIIHDPQARVIHDHQYRPLDVHRREYLLGRSAWSYAQHNPSFMNDLLGYDINSPEEIVWMRAAQVRQRRDAIRIEKSFLSHADLLSDSPSQAYLDLLVEHWVLLKRYLWRWGVLDACDQIGPRWSLVGSLEHAKLVQ